MSFIEILEKLVTFIPLISNVGTPLMGSCITSLINLPIVITHPDPIFVILSEKWSFESDVIQI